MKVVNDKEGAERIAWLSELQSAARRNDVLIAVTRRLRCFPPNTSINIKHPWKPSERFSIRAWCPLHDRRWARLIVTADEACELTFDCSAGCNQQLIRDRIGALDDASSRERSDSYSYSSSASDSAIVGRGSSGTLLDARARFQSAQRAVASRFRTDDPAA